MAGNEVISRNFIHGCFAWRYTVYFLIVLSYATFCSFVTRVIFRKARTTALFWYVVHSSHDMLCLPPGVLDKPNKVQRMQRTHEPRLYVHLPLFFLVPFRTVLRTISGRCEVTPL